ncbi:ABC transporter permease [Candidatus Similichlamydia laticola]|uniref:Spermidine Putrescine ABC transporter permease component PotB n=1 Tax=Candidatus Similichlamydia laticola TaxID=2170265 RepID=A0A369KC70_9BACT|nr:ABC transporter permease [Candidatus Similichlamydia laticola]RDB31508.1 Spermidine Putrescine ABC transporter permease component PotB [Candidatus Similichlamydia laticola]
MKFFKKRTFLFELAGFFPAILWNGFFFLFPLLTVLWVACHTSDMYGEILPGWTWKTFFSALYSPNFFFILVQTLFMSALCCLISVCLAIPIGYYITCLPRQKRLRILFLIMSVFWTSSLIRIFSWKLILHPDGFLKSCLIATGWALPESVLLYTKGAVLLTMVHVAIPFAILPICASADRFDSSLMEASSDLGASVIQSFLYVFIPGIRLGVLQATITVFLQTISSYTFSTLVGGTSCEMIGNKIVRLVLLERNLPVGAALSLISSFIAILCTLFFYTLFSLNRKKRSL